MEKQSLVLPEFYASHGSITDPQEYTTSFTSLPDSISEIVDVIHGLFLHVFWAERYGVTVSGSQKEDVQLRHLVNILGRLAEIDPAPLVASRSLEKRFFGNCRDHSVFLVSILRSKGVPARARCGFAKYFRPDKFEDHWICEYWDRTTDRWISVDPQLDEFQQKELGVTFDSLNLPPDQFVSGAEAWSLCRQGLANPDDFGIFNLHGLGFVRGNLIRDLAALNKMELLPWDSWGLISKEEETLSLKDYQLLDKVADLIIKNDPEIYQIYQTDSQLTVPQVITSYIDGNSSQVKLS